MWPQTKKKLSSSSTKKKKKRESVKKTVKRREKAIKNILPGSSKDDNLFIKDAVDNLSSRQKMWIIIKILQITYQYQWGNKHEILIW